MSPKPSVLTFPADLSAAKTKVYGTGIGNLWPWRISAAPLPLSPCPRSADVTPFFFAAGRHPVNFAHRDGKRFIVKADDLLTEFLSLEKDAIAPKVLTGTRRAKRRLDANYR
jgi:hypothetical protein